MVEQQKSKFLQVPIEIQKIIMCILPKKDLISVLRTSKALHNQKLKHELFKREYFFENVWENLMLKQFNSLEEKTKLFLSYNKIENLVFDTDFSINNFNQISLPHSLKNLSIESNEFDFNQPVDKLPKSIENLYIVGSQGTVIAVVWGEISMAGSAGAVSSRGGGGLTY